MCDRIYSQPLEFPEDTIFYKLVATFLGEYYSPYVRCHLPVGEWLRAENVNPDTYAKENLSILQKRSNGVFGHSYNKKVCGYSAFTDLGILRDYSAVNFMSLRASIIKCHFRGRIVKAFQQGSRFYFGEEMKVIGELTTDDYSQYMKKSGA